MIGHKVVAGIDVASTLAARRSTVISKFDGTLVILVDNIVADDKPLCLKE